VTDQTTYRALEEAAATKERPVFGRDALVVCDNLVKIYKVDDLEVVALQGLDLLVNRGAFISIVGASGSGKSTLMNILGGLDIPSAGEVSVAGHNLLTMSEEERTHYRRNVIGFVWQQTARNLVPYLTALENVMLPMMLDDKSKRARRDRAWELLQLVGLSDRSDHRPEQLSGGEQQRVAIAVALANRPDLLLADEPTGELDTATSGEVFDVFRRVNEEEDVTIIVVTHDPFVVGNVTRTVAIRDGRTSTETLRYAEIDEAGGHSMVAEEFVILDRAGRLQLPEHYVEELQLDKRVRMTLDPDHANIWPDRETGREGAEG
jgi:ABC-type lipoprotein export system ATPase subunit